MVYHMTKNINAQKSYTYFKKSYHEIFQKMDFEYLRFYVKTRWLLGETPIQISNDLKTAYKDQAPSYDLVLKWVRAFNG